MFSKLKSTCSLSDKALAISLIQSEKTNLEAEAKELNLQMEKLLDQYFIATKKLSMRQHSILTRICILEDNLEGLLR